MRAPTADGNELYYESAGEGFPVALIHGLADDHTLWRHQVPALVERYRVISVDIRGHGRSGKPRTPYTVPLFADDVVSLLDTLGIGRAVLVGLSMGGGISQTVAMRRPDRVHALALISTSSTFNETTRERFRWRAATAEREGVGPLVDSMVERWFTADFRARRPEEVEVTRSTVLAGDPLAFAAACRANAARDWTDELVRISCPTLFIGGGQDPADARRNAETFRRHLRDLEVQILQNASHLLPVECPQRTNEMLGGFLDLVTLAGHAR